MVMIGSCSTVAIWCQQGVLLYFDPCCLCLQHALQPRSRALVFVFVFQVFVCFSSDSLQLMGSTRTSNRECISRGDRVTRHGLVRVVAVPQANVI